MKNNSKSYLLLKGFIALGGVFEGVMGAIILLWGDLIIYSATQMQVVPNYPLYWRVLGLLAMALGTLQIFASFQPERYVIIPLVACFVRFILPILTFLQIFDTPSMFWMLIISTIFDLFLAMITLVLLVYNGLIWKDASGNDSVDS
ncbi:MAG: hypothetical protein ACXAEU_13470 [Candidatus Hodarchaeales archaeon]